MGGSESTTSFRRIGAVLVAVLALPAGLLVAGVLEQITDTKSGYFGYYGFMDDSGSNVYVISNTDQFGGNPQRAYQIFKYDTTTGAGEQVTSFADGIYLGGRTGYFAAAGHIWVSDDEQWLSFLSRGNLTGLNHDESPEVFVMHPNGTHLSQVSNDPSPNAGTVTDAAMSGSGDWVAFASNSDPLGTNPDGHFQIFHVHRNGTGLSQLTQLEQGNIYYVGISDDGQRMVFNHNGNPLGTNPDFSYEAFAVEADGTLRQLSFANSGLGVLAPSVSGNGEKVGFHSNADLLGLNPDQNTEVFVMNWDGSLFRQMSSSVGFFGSRYPSFTDDAQLVFFDSDQMLGAQNADRNLEIVRMNTDGTSLTMLTDTSSPALMLVPFVCGDGSRITFITLNGAVPGGNNPDFGYEMNVMTSSGTGILQLTDHLEVETGEPDITPDGSRIVFSSNADLTGGNPGLRTEIFRVDADGSELTQVTDIAIFGAQSPSIAADGNTIAIVSRGNPLGTNADFSFEIFRIDADGSNLSQLTSAAGGSSDMPDISPDGSVVVFHSSSDLTGGNPNGSLEVFVVHTDGSGIRQLSSGPLGAGSGFPRVDQDGTWVVFYSGENPTGGNADGSIEVYRVRTDGQGLELLTGNTPYVSRHPDISGAGDLVVYSSGTDPLGTNPEHNYELFLLDLATSTVTQLTSTTDEQVWWPRISQDGSTVYFISNGEFTEQDPDETLDVYRIAVAGGAIERVGALRRNYYNALEPDGGPLAAVSADGARAVFYGFGDLVEQNLDLSSEVFLVDETQPLRIRVSAAAPTLVTWAHEARSLRYDVIRGDVADLASGGGNTVNLGSVVCLENDSPDANTTGFEDFEIPVSGQTFFYLYRGSQGSESGPGSYGPGSSGGQRIAGAGDCAPA